MPEKLKPRPLTIRTVTWKQHNNKTVAALTLSAPTTLFGTLCLQPKVTSDTSEACFFSKQDSEEMCT
ncbi:hypothetical protein Q5P01_003848 [Channa striata]|uniref:Uncharacterized protein n=1 Tax=Channa striata TaxID=64152 RepID=A0AA88T0Q2_CHASR|nr:hypothetical protein Q5P01_003848 [Channa striata]